MSNFFDNFAQQRPRESSGASSANRFDYQKNWAFCELIDLHLSGNDYLMVFEHHEDIVVLNSENSPTNAKFYQVKSKRSGNWTINSLVKNKNKNEDESSSIIGKLYVNQILFPENADELIFVSNQGLSDKLVSGLRGLECINISFSELNSICKEKVWKAVQGENDTYCDLNGLSKLFIVRTPLNTENHTILTKGKLVDFFNDQFPDRPANVSLAYKTIFDEIRRKTNVEDVPQTSTELRRTKSISRTEFAHMTGLVAQSQTTNELWVEAVQHLSACGIGPLKQRNLKRHWDAYTVDKMNVSNEPLILLQSKVRSAITEQLDIDDNASIDKLIDTVVSSISDTEGYSEEYVRSATLYEVINYDPLSPTHSQSKDKSE